MTDPLPSRDLMAFAAAVETGTVQGAAEALDLTQSAATKRLQSLERRLGLELLRRGHDGVRPTAAGRTLYPEARRALDALASAERAVLGARETAELRIIASHTVGEFLLPGWLTAFRVGAARQVSFEVEVANSERVLDAIRDDNADLGFVEGHDPLDGFEARSVLEDRIVPVVAPGHRWSSRSSIRPTELRNEAYVAREQGSGTRAVAEARLAEVGVELVPALTLSSLEGLKRSLSQGGFTLISDLALDRGPDRSLVALKLKGVEIRRELVAVRRPGADATEAMRSFWEWLDQLAEANG